MIKLELQMFAKSAASQRESRKSKAISKYTSGSSTQQTMMHEEKKPAPEKKKSTKGEVITQVRSNEEYVVYLMKNGQETAVATRTGSQILGKMYYDNDRKAWISNAKGWKYKIRKKPGT